MGDGGVLEGVSGAKKRTYVTILSTVRFQKKTRAYYTFFRLSKIERVLAKI